MEDLQLHVMDIQLALLIQGFIFLVVTKKRYDPDPFLSTFFAVDREMCRF